MQDKPCPFCDFAKLSGENIAESKGTFWVMWEPFPVGIGHVKLIPKRHVTSSLILTDQEQKDFWKTLKATRRYLDRSLKRKPDGYNWGVNEGEAAGQTIAHLHIHVIPRYKGDVENPRGGVRNIKPALVAW